MSPSKFLTLLALPLVGSLVSGCISSDSGIIKGAQGCEEFVPGADLTQLKVDAKVRDFMLAANDFRTVSQRVKQASRTACAGIATDLDGNDSWSALGESDDSISNAQHTGACDVAAQKIGAVMSGQTQANFALAIARGACHPDFAAQAACDASCKAAAVCDSGTVVTRCEPGELSVQCDGVCQAQASCEGNFERQANCMGACESTCTGLCKGTCITREGKRSDNDPNCHGKCSSSCNGQCAGRCKLEVATGLNCGAQVACKGGCTGNISAPLCETSFTAPVCTMDTTCYANCSARVAANTICDPPRVELFADATAGVDVAKVVASINAHLPALLAVAESDGQLVVKAVENLVTTGQAVVDASGDLDGKSIACATAAAKAAVDSEATLSVSVKASTNVTQTCREKSI